MPKIVQKRFVYVYDTILNFTRNTHSKLWNLAVYKYRKVTIGLMILFWIRAAYLTFSN